MTQETQPQQAMAAQHSALAPDLSELTDAKLTLVVGGSDDDIKGDITVNPKRA
jgi:hypothetical protein